MNFDTIIAAVREERAYQDGLHGSIQDAPHEMGTWILLIEAELNEAKLALIKGGEGRNALRSELVQVAALCVAALEQHGLATEHTGRAI